MVNGGLFSQKGYNELDWKVHNFHTTNDGEPSEQPHCPPYWGQHVHWLGRSVFGDSVERGRVKIDPHISQLVLPFIFWKIEMYNCIATFFETFETIEPDSAGGNGKCFL